MGDFTALAATSETIKRLLLDRMELPDTLPRSSFTITVSTPTQADDAIEGAAEDPRINLFLYRVVENASLKNQHLPGQASPGSYGDPPLCLELHFLLTAYGSTLEGDHPNELRAQQLLGSAMRVLHDHPVITDALVTSRDPVGRPVLEPSLRGREPVRLHLAPVDVEDLSEVWTALTLRYRLSVAYVVSVVQIESRRRALPPRLVGEPPAGGPRIVVATYRRPEVLALTVSRAGSPESSAAYARIGDRVTVSGSHLTDGPTLLRVGDVMVDSEHAGRDKLSLVLPDDQRLGVGAQPLWAETLLTGTATNGIASNISMVTLVPRLDSTTEIVTASERSMTLTGSRLYDAKADCETLVGDVAVAGTAYTIASENSVELTLPDGLPDHHCRALLSGDLASFPSMDSVLELRVTIGGETNVTVTLARRPTTLGEAAPLLEAALRRASGSSAFAGARVAAVGSRLAVVPGGRRAAVEVASGSAANALRLTTSRGARDRRGYTSGVLSPFPVLTSGAPAMTVTIGGVAHRVALATPPGDLVEAAAVLEVAIRSAGAETVFTQARVGRLGHQLLVVADSDDVTVEADAADDATVGELELHAAYPVRVRVNGLENLERESVVLPR